MDTAQPQKRFFLGGLATPVLARVAHQTATRLTLQQELPFLQLESEMLDEDGRSGSLTGVSVTLRDGVPCLMLDVSYGDAGREETTPFETGTIVSDEWDAASLDLAADSLVARLAGSTRARRRTDETQPYGVRTGEDARVIVPTPVATAELASAISANLPASIAAVNAEVAPSSPALPVAGNFSLLPVPWYLRWMNWFSQFFTG